MIIKIAPDIEKAKSLLQMAQDRESFINSVNFDKFLTGKIESYYEVIKELATALALTEGVKAEGEGAHKELIDFLFENKFITEYELGFIQDLRVKRNKSFYERKQINLSYLESRESTILQIISKLKSILKEKLR